MISILSHRDGTVAELVLARGSALNAMSTAMAEALVEAAATVGGNTAVRATVLSSDDPRAFCVGADLRERSGFDRADRLQARPLSRAVYAAVRDLPMPVIAAVHGYALGGGYELALGADVIVADETAVVGLPEVSVGVIPGGGGTQLLPRRVGAARATELILTGRRVGAAEALRLGMVDTLVEVGGDRDSALDLAGLIADNSPTATRAAKRALRAAWGATLEIGLANEDEAWHEAALSSDWAEGIAAFQAKRTPRWARPADRLTG